MKGDRPGRPRGVNHPGGGSKPPPYSDAPPRRGINADLYNGRAMRAPTTGERADGIHPYIVLISSLIVNC